MKPTSLKLVIDHYRRHRDDAVAAQSRVQMELDGARRTLQTLEQYRDEQLQRARDSAASPLSATHLLLQTRFSGKLDEAIALQTQRVDQLRQRIDACRAQVLAQQQRLKAIETIEEQRAAGILAKGRRAEQLATDERAANAHAREAREARETAADRQAERPFNLP